MRSGSIFLLPVVAALWTSASAGVASIVMTMLCRDENVNLKANLLNWVRVVDYFVFVVDNRTIDGSVKTIESILGPTSKKYTIVWNDFTGFGAARTFSLETAWNVFPNASHVLIADPDWHFDLKTIDKTILGTHTNADVFRFTIFDAERGGRSHTRKMDWLLRNKPGLSMRYNLHEVLSIGDYEAVHIPWEVREAAKEGTWHSTVGHGDSTSAERYKSDLKLLYKDLEQYGHDPHTHYYLGSAHQSYAMQAQHTLGLYSDEVQHHVDQAIRFLELRARSFYHAELLEQRWAALIELGNIYTSMRVDDQKAIYWLNTCRDYNPQYIECPMLLAQFYVSLGQLAPALTTLDAMLRTASPADMQRTSQYMGLWECDAPLVIIDVLAKKAQFQGVSSEEAMHFFTLYQSRKSKDCKQTSTINRATKAVFNKAVNARSVDYFEAPNAFCESPPLQQHLAQRDFVFHPCDAFRQHLVSQRQCEVFSVTLQPAYEEFQVNSVQKQFVGAAILPDIVHHAFQGNSSRFMSKRRQMRFLFAEQFSVQMVYNLLGQLHRAKITDYAIEVVSPLAAVREEFLRRTEACREHVAAAPKQQVFFKVATLQEYLSTSSTPRGWFDYIEYNGGLSKADRPQEELAALSGLLRDDTGVLGLTYFTHNHHTTRLRALVDGRNATFMAPFSLEATRLVHAYLEQHKLGQFKTDPELVVLLGGEERESSSVRTSLEQIVPRVQWLTYTREEAQSKLAGAGLVEVSRLPTAYASPFGEVDAFDVLKFKSFGLTEELFTQDLMASFRNTIYATKTSTAAAVPTGRRQLTLAAFNRSLSPEDVFVVDRMRTLGTTFQDIESMAARSPSIDFKHYALPGDTKLSHIVTRSIAPCLPHLSSKPTLRGLHALNKQYAARHSRPFDEQVAQRELLGFLAHLEGLNFLAYETNAPTSETKAAFKGATLNTLADRKSAQSGAATTEKPLEEKKAGGLNFKLPAAGINVKSLPESLQKKKAELEAERLAASSAPRTAAAPPASPPGLKGQSDSTAQSSALGTDTAQLSYEEQVARMRALGYSESMMEDLLEDERSPQARTILPSAAATDAAFASLRTEATKQSAEVSSSGEAAKEAKSAKSVIELLTRFTANRAAKSASADKQNQEAATVSPNPAVGVSSRTQPSPPVDATPVLSFKLPQKDTEPEPELIIAGGLKLPKATKPSPRNIVVPPAPQIKISGASEGLQLGRKPVERIVPATRSLRADQIQMPPLLSASSVMGSFRRLDCSTGTASDCQEPRVLKRKTAHGTSTSARKVEFDVAQLQYLLSHRTLKLTDQAQSMVGNIEKSYSEVAKYLQEYKLDDPYRVVRLNSNSALKSKTAHLNRVVHLQPDEGLGAEALVHAGAIQYLHSIRNELQAHDFVVVDVILKDAALRELSSLLLSSTVWFDATNGAAFAAHHNDGLAFPSVHTLVQHVALALSSDDRPLSVTSYYSLAMALHHPAHSPVFMGNKDDLIVVLWLSPSSSQPAAPSNAFDGLRIYDESSAGKLFSQGVSVYPSAHCDFLSRSSSLAIDLHARCNSSNSEFVPRMPNRLVVVRSKKLCTLLTPGDARLRDADFDQSTMVALVMVFTPSV